MFLLNSRLGHFSAAPECFSRKVSHNQGLLFSRSYEDNLPSSLTRVLSRALEYSSYPPVSVLVRLPTATRVYFLEASRYIIGSPRGLPLNDTQYSVDGFTYQPTICHYEHFRSFACLTYFVNPLSLPLAAQEYLTCFPSPTLFSLGLGTG